MGIKIKAIKPQKAEKPESECLKTISDNLSIIELNQLARAIPQMKKTPFWTVLKNYLSKY